MQWDITDTVISIHALLAESDHETYVVMEATKVISIHALLAESDLIILCQLSGPYISIHALLAESDLPTDGLFFIAGQFLSTLSLRRATALGLLGWLRVLISIHALLAESDRAF